MRLVLAFDLHLSGGDLRRVEAQTVREVLRDDLGQGFADSLRGVGQVTGGEVEILRGPSGCVIPSVETYATLTTKSSEWKLRSSRARKPCWV